MRRNSLNLSTALLLVLFAAASLRSIAAEKPAPQDPKAAQQRAQAATQLQQLFHKGLQENQLTADDKQQSYRLIDQFLPRHGVEGASWKKFYFDNDGISDVLSCRLMAADGEEELLSVRFSYEPEPEDHSFSLYKVADLPAAAIPDSFWTVYAGQLDVTLSAKADAYRNPERLQALLATIDFKTLAAAMTSGK